MTFIFMGEELRSTIVEKIRRGLPELHICRSYAGPVTYEGLGAISSARPALLVSLLGQSSLAPTSGAFDDCTYPVDAQSVTTQVLYFPAGSDQVVRYGPTYARTGSLPSKHQANWPQRNLSVVICRVKA